MTKRLQAHSVQRRPIKTTLVTDCSSDEIKDWLGRFLDEARKSEMDEPDRLKIDNVIEGFTADFSNDTEEFLWRLPQEWIDRKKLQTKNIAKPTDEKDTLVPTVRCLLQLCFFLRKQAKSSLPKMAETFSLLQWGEDGKGIRPLIPIRYILPQPTDSSDDPDINNFAGCDFRGADFSKCKLSGADFGGAKLTRATFVEAILFGANFEGAVRTDADFSGAKRADFSNANTEVAVNDTDSTKIKNHSSDLDNRNFFVTTDGTRLEVTNFFIKDEGSERQKKIGEVANNLIDNSKNFNLFPSAGPLISISIGELYQEFIEYIELRKQRMGLWFFQLGSTCDSRKLAFILAVGQLLESLTAKPKTAPTADDFVNLITNLIALKKYTNMYTSILHPRIFGNSNYSLSTYFDTLVKKILAIGKVKSQPNLFTDTKNRKRLNSQGKDVCEKLGISEIDDLSLDIASDSESDNSDNYKPDYLSSYS